MRCISLAVVFLVPSISWAQDAPPKAGDVQSAIDRGLGFLTKDALAWKEKHNCVSCHHAALVVWAMRDAKGRGHKIDESVLAELTKWSAEAGDGRSSQKRPESAPKAASARAMWFALALAVDPKPDAVALKGLDLLYKTVKSEQIDDGSWVAWPETRPPIFGESTPSLTALGSLSLHPAAMAGDEKARAIRDKGVKWLTAAKADDELQTLALKLILWKRIDRPAVECEDLIKQLRDRQNADGGWSQAKGLESDAWATGQTLYALAGAGAKDAAIQRGQAFLVRSQRDDGSWAMKSRSAKAGSTGATNLIPIIGAGSAWGVLGLVRSQ